VDGQGSRFGVRFAPARKVLVVIRDPDRPTYHMVFVVDFQRVRNEQDLARLLPCSEGLIRSVLSGAAHHFQRHQIPKKNPSRGFREVWEIETTELSDALKAFNTRFFDFATQTLEGFPSDAAHGYCPGRSIVSNAKVHIGARLLLRADINSFFPTILTHRVKGLFSDMGMTPEGADLVARFVTLHGTLPLGFPSSPTLANALCVGLDRDLTALATERSCLYTRYADDLTFSSKGSSLPSRIEISSILKHHGFTLAAEKFRIRKLGQSFYVTGLSISDPKRPRAPKDFKRGLRQELYFIEKFGLHKHLGRKDYPTYQEGINKIDGSIRFLMSVERDLALRLKQRWDAALEKAGESPVYQPRRERPPRQVSLFIDESIIKTPAGECFAVGCVTTEDADLIRENLNELWQGLLHDPFAARRAKVEKQGLHWADLPEDARSELVKTVAALPIRAYVAYTSLSEDVGYEETYLHLLREILRPRFIALDGCDVTITCELNSNVRQDAIKKSIDSLYSQLVESRSRAPRSSPAVKIAKKLEEPCLALADCMLGVLGQYAIMAAAQKGGDLAADEGQREEQGQAMTAAAQKQGQVPMTAAAQKGGDLALTRFERLRTKFRTIRADKTNEVFTRRRHFTPWKDGDPFTRG
jgi:RNA-directed DNA polymerase